MAYASLNVKRRTSGLIRLAVTGVRGAVAAKLAAAGASGVTNADLQLCWPGDGTARKVHGCMVIMAGDDYGYPIQRESDPVHAAADRYRFNPDAAIVAPAVSPGATNPPPAVTSAPAPAAPAPSDDIGAADTSESMKAAAAATPDPVPAKAKRGKGGKGK